MVSECTAPLAMCTANDFTRSPDSAWLGEQITDSIARGLFPQIKQSGINKLGDKVVGLKCGIGPGAPYPNMASPDSVFYCEDSGRPKNNESINKEIGSNYTIPLMVFIVGGKMYNYGMVEVICKATRAGRNGWVLKRPNHRTRSQAADAKRVRADNTEEEKGNLEQPAKKTRSIASTDGFEHAGVQYDSILEFRHHLFFSALRIKHIREPLTMHRLGKEAYSYTIDFLLQGVAIDKLLNVPHGPEQFVFVEVKPCHPTHKEMQRCENFCREQRRPVLLMFGSTFAHPLEDDTNYNKKPSTAERYQRISKRKDAIRGWLCYYENDDVIWHQEIYFAQNASDDGCHLTRLASSSDAHLFDSAYTNAICDAANRKDIRNGY